ncbi:uncharacterized protein LOC133821211 isoform X2 [Humulus lupulus]|uniref:uncharacterized protein LOC133821211 isoform X2 n=1 Tax=Humulus lupulus TaxID=3486 RepID=UPI002B40618F|nr:uncharacterized protein LOC133821211 isoform X2 [Humulus lupulus]
MAITQSSLTLSPLLKSASEKKKKKKEKRKDMFESSQSVSEEDDIKVEDSSKRKFVKRKLKDKLSVQGHEVKKLKKCVNEVDYDSEELEVEVHKKIKE